MPTNRTFKYRVDHAARVIREGRPTSRAFDNCFEEGDGTAVVKALVTRAEKNPKAWENLPRYVAQTSIDKAKTNP